MPEKGTESKKEERISGESAQKILEMSEVSLWLDDYDDIFSDFDPRPFSQRSLSDDFLSEAKKASRDKDPNKIELRFLISEQKRDLKSENLIKKRLHEHFNKHMHQLKREISAIRGSSLIAALAGVFMMLAASYISTLGQNFLFRFLFVLLEPAGWFVTWFALDRLFYTTQSKKPEYEFYEKMSKAEITFYSY